MVSELKNINADRKLKVCLVAPLPPPYGGIARWTEMITCHAQNVENVQIDVVDTAVRWRSVHDLSIFRRLIGGGCQLVRDFIRFVARLMSQRPDVIHLTTSGQFGLFRDHLFVATARLLRIPVVYHLRFGRVPQMSAQGSREWRLMARVLRKVQSVIVLDDATAQAIAQHLPEVKVSKIPNCIDIAALIPLTTEFTPRKRTVMYLGWVIPSKGMSELFEAWTSLHSDDWRLEIAGPVDPEYQRQLLATYRPVGIDFLGELAHGEALNQLAQADIFVLPSHTEGFPNVVLEAMALGRAIVATAVGAIPEMLAEGCGKLIAPRNTTDLSQALKSLMADEGMRTEMGTRAQIRAAKEFSLTAVFDAYVQSWRQTSDRRREIVTKENVE